MGKTGTQSLQPTVPAVYQFVKPPGIIVVQTGPKKPKTNIIMWKSIDWYL
ncbi:MAG: hypothetical protein QXT96_04760 [Candidatus Bathyarchaeia archaeon]